MLINNMKKFKLILIVASLIMMFVGVNSCTKMDEYKKYVAGGEIVYPGIFDSLKVISGKNRAMITGFIKSDPKVRKYKIFWNGGSDSLEADLHRTGGVDTMKQIVNNLPEGELTFEIRTYDSSDNKSVPMTVSGSIYGDGFQKSIDLFGNRTISSTMFGLDSTLQLQWQDIDSYSNITGMHIYYHSLENELKDTIISAELLAQATVLNDVDISKPMSYNTLFIPEEGDLDTLSTNAIAVPAVSEILVPNSGDPFSSTTDELYDNRWSDLSSWRINAEAKNHGGYGGFSLDGDGTMLDLESGWGAPAILNGKLYQVHTLPAGNYTLDVSPLVWNGIQDTVYLTVAMQDSLPDFNKVQTAANVKFSLLKENASVKFELSKPTKVAFGFQANYIKDGQGFKVKKVHLYYNPL